MMLPSIFGEDLMDEWMDDFDRDFFEMNTPFYGKVANVMKTDVRETDSAYEVAVDLPGFRKEDVKLSLDNGYLTISASGKHNNDKKDSDGKLIRKERYAGSVTRSFYVGDAVTKDEVHAKFEDGVLRITLPKHEAKKEIPTDKTIAIEG